VWDLKGATAPKKLSLLKGEGVLFDSRGVIKDAGLIFDDFQLQAIDEA
jgi:hypothetical protein